MDFSFLKSKNLRILFWIIFILVCIFPKILSSTNETGDPFTYSTIAVSQASIDAGHILIHPFEPVGGTLQHHADSLSERASVTSLLIVISQVTGTQVENLIFFPLNGLILLVLSFALAKLVSKSTLVAAAFTLFLAYEPAINVLSYNVFYIGLGFSLFFTFLILFIKPLKSRAFSEKGIFLLIITFVALYLTYYTSEVNAVAFSLAIAVGVFVLLKCKKSQLLQTKLRQSVTILALIFTLIFIQFDNIFYSYFSQIMSTKGLSYLSNYLSYVHGMFSSETTINNTAYKTETFTSNIGLLLIISIFIPILLYTMYFSIKFLKKSSLLLHGQIDVKYVLFFALMFPWLVDIIIYSSLEAFPFKYFLLMFSFLAFFSINELKFLERKIKRLKFARIFLLCLILVLCVAKFGAWFEDPKLGYAQSFDSSIKSTSQWTSQYTIEGNILTDLKTGGRLLEDVTELRKVDSVYIHLFDQETIGFLYITDSEGASKVFERNSINYLVLSYASVSQPIEGANWLNSKPLGSDFYSLINYSDFEKIYDDGKGVVYRSTS
jgi:hypothetical protein